MMEKAWRELVARWAVDRGHVTADAIEQLRRSETYLFAHGLWVLGESGRDLWRLLDQAWTEAGNPEAPVGPRA